MSLITRGFTSHTLISRGLTARNIVVIITHHLGKIFNMFGMIKAAALHGKMSPTEINAKIATKGISGQLPQ